MSCRACFLFGFSALIIASAGCSDLSAVGQNSKPNPEGKKDAVENRPAPGGEGRRGGQSLRQIMNRLAQGPQSLTRVIGDQLDAETPNWDAIVPQAKEYADLAAAMATERPSRGTPESWERLTKSYTEAAVALHKAAQAKDVEAALKAHGLLANSCNECHREHRSQGRGGFGGGPGGPGGPGAGFGGPPPIGQILSANTQDRLNLTPEQRQELEALQKDADARLDKILSEEQKQQLKQMRESGARGFGGGFRGGPGGPGPGGGPPGGNRGAPDDRNAGRGAPGTP